MTSSVPNLRPGRHRTVDDVPDETPIEHLACHCGHVVKLNDRVLKVEVHFGLAAKFIGICLTAIIGIGVKVAWDIVKSQVRSETPVSHAGERLAPDRIPEPSK